MAWLDFDQPTPEVTISNGVATVHLRVFGLQTAAWRAEYNDSALAVTAQAVEEDGRTVLLVELWSSSIAAVFDALNNAVELLVNPWVPPVPADVEALGGAHVVENVVHWWWDLYQTCNVPNAGTR